MKPRIIPTLLGLTLAFGVAFAVWPQADLTVAEAFYGRGGFPMAHEHVWEAVRKTGYWLPLALLAGSLLLYGLRRLQVIRTGPSGRSALFLALTMALGPGLLVNVALKDHSHRPRPVQVSQFGGKDVFRPWYRFDGACVRNCSFVSGEVSAAVWTLAPALLTPLAVRGAAIAGALAFGVGIAFLRLAFGGHFLSDVVFAALFTLLIVATCAWLLGLWPPVRRADQTPAQDTKPGALRERQPSL